MKKQLLIIGIVVIFMSVGLSGCNKISPSYTSEKNRFVGTWAYVVPTGTGSNYSFTYYFFSNGTFMFNKNGVITNGTFDIIDGNLWLASNSNENKDYTECSYVFSENNTILTIDGTSYKKQ